jgi:tRNA nucleotidyltransferase (CCA-adding enzyme)
MNARMKLKDFINFTADCRRRDFTINAMSLGFDGDLLDPFNGFQDLQKGLVMFVGDADQRIQEDYLRILRWFRFRGRFGMAMSFSARRAVERNAHGLCNISRERVWSEVRRILAGPDGPWIMAELQQLGVAKHCDLPILESVDPASEVHQLTRDPVTLMVALYGQSAYSVLQKFKASRDEQNQALYLASEWHSSQSPFWLMAVDELHREWALELAALRCMDDFDRAVLETWEVPVFPVSGNDIMALGVKQGPDVGKILHKLKYQWAVQNFAASKEDLLANIIA